MKKLLQILFLGILISSFTACIDEDDFNFDSLAQTTINPTINAPLINTEITLSDFLDLEQLSDTANGFEIIQVNENGDSYLELALSFKDSFDIRDFREQFEVVNDINIDLIDLYIPNLGDLGLEELETSEILYYYPDPSVSAKDISIEIEELEDEIRIDSIYILSGGLIIHPTNVAPLTAYIEFTSNTIKSRETGELFSQRIQISNTNSLINQTLDLSNYTIFLKDSIVNNTTKNFIDLKYRLIFNIANELYQGDNHDIDIDISLTPLTLDAVFGDLGNKEFNVNGSVALDFLQDSLLNAIAESNSIDFEKFSLELSTSTNIGVDMNIIPSIYTLTSDGQTYNVFNQINPITINGANVLGETAYTNNIVLESDASAIEVFPDSLIYDINFNFRDNNLKHKNSAHFISPNDAFVTLDAKASLPLKAKLSNLHYEIDFDAFKFVEEMNYLSSTTLQFYIENSFPVDLSIDIYLIDSNNVVFDTLITEPFLISGANIDSEGYTLSPSAKNVKITLENNKYESLKKSSKMRLTATLNTSSDSQGQQPYVRFSNDAKIKIKTSVSVTGNITHFNF
ncbi:MAG: hypothetical protein J6U84_03185 [Bacteroidales bacterium]|nr:hypothetical protein [Bacteroidales bacterium]